MNQGLGADSGTGLENGAESSGNQTASDLAGPHRQVARMVMGQLKPDQSIHLDALMDALAESGGEASPSEIIAALFELEILGLAKQLPGRNFVKVW